MHYKLFKKNNFVYIIALTLLLIIQLINGSKEKLATNNIFNKTINPIYKALGIEIIPKWPINSWVLSNTKGVVNSDETFLYIDSQITNHFSKPLPYPLILISITNRFGDIVSHKIVKSKYNLTNKNINQPNVPSKDSIDVKIKINSPSNEMTGFKLSICYEHYSNMVRCSNENLKNKT